MNLAKYSVVELSDAVRYFNARAQLHIKSGRSFSHALEIERGRSIATECQREINRRFAGNPVDYRGSN